MQLHKLLDINEEKKPNDTKYEVSQKIKCLFILVKQILTFVFYWSGIDWESRVDV